LFFVYIFANQEKQTEKNFDTLDIENKVATLHSFSLGGLKRQAI